MSRLSLYRYALLLLTLALLVVSFAYVREHQQNTELRLQSVQLRPWNVQQSRELAQWKETALELEQEASSEEACLQVGFEGVFMGGFIIYKEGTPKLMKESFANLLQEAHELVERSRKWRVLAQEMSQEADRRHLDKSFLRVHD